jgi:hypothetical protein
MRNFSVFLPLILYLISPDYYLQAGTPAAITNFINPLAACNWSGVAGQAFNRNGQPVSGLLVKVSGVVGGQPVERYAFTGGSLQIGPGGYEIALADFPFNSNGVLSLQLFDSLGVPLSHPIIFDTYADCQRNLILINLFEFIIAQKIYLPLVSKP